MRFFILFWLIISAVKGENMVIALSFGDEKMGAEKILVELDSSASARDFAALLPLEVEVSDYVGKEKIFSLPKRLKTGANDGAGYDPQIGDLFYFSPWGNVGIFYEKQPPYNGLIRLGILKDSKNALAKLKAKKQNFVIKIEAVK
ncbi:hypothetical protein BKN38_08685 [Helicobacter sp. CLO-3]|uniref:cyclophilin-like fold protein n=1 Tax=unclassified Helicobacter TaxID=2593540 RepID=UPI00080596B2|nr:MULTISPECIES: cyclophilin-like fold protein [unclassified Helicobacter]OBV28924.1 hypothetical protein BA723_07430 [Helicobacter sp. CLO-3]OHU81584.1 hypothetical protein BKN38_08685 [Helicobacter sp. CLO-3]